MPRWLSLRRRVPVAARPRVVLHVGRSKAGSTTIQDFCRAAHRDLAAQGVDYVMFGHLKDAEPGIPGFGTFEELASFAAANPGRTVLVSNEFMFAWPVDFSRSAAAALGGCNVSIVIYLRPYDGWVQSAYTEETRHGRNIRAIDGFMDGYPLRTSAWDYLEGWGGSFGWDRLHLGSLAPGGLSGGELMTDFAGALGLLPLVEQGAHPLATGLPLGGGRRLRGDLLGLGDDGLARDGGLGPGGGPVLGLEGPLGLQAGLDPLDGGLQGGDVADHPGGLDVLLERD